MSSSCSTRRTPPHGRRGSATDYYARASRLLTPAEADALRAAIELDAASLEILGTDPDAMALGDAIAGVLTECGWRVITGSYMRTGLTEGILLRLPMTVADSPALVSLGDALRDLGFDVRVRERCGHAQLIVGRNPL